MRHLPPPGESRHRSAIGFERATDSLAHRRPDGRGTVVIQANRTARLEIGLGSRRLAILDLSPQGHQPMHDAETGNWIVYDGETYNLRELRTQLQDEGVRFVSQSDTEVLLKAYGLGREVPRRVARNVCICHLGCQKIASAAGSRSDGH